METKSGNRGFALIELLIVIGIIGFLAAAILVAVDPMKRIQDSRDARRYSESNAILNAILAKQVDDRALYGGMATAPVIASAMNAQVIVSSDAGIVCNSAASPACPTRVLDVAGANKNCVVNVSGTGTGSGTAASVGTAVTGSAEALFTAELAVGDTVTSSSTGACTVASIADAAHFTCAVAPGAAFAGAFTVTHAASALFPAYIAPVPTDPTGGTPTVGHLAIGASNSGYYLQRTAGNRIEVGACYPEQAASISVRR